MFFEKIPGFFLPKLSNSRFFGHPVKIKIFVKIKPYRQNHFIDLLKFQAEIINS